MIRPPARNGDGAMSSMTVGASRAAATAPGAVLSG